MPLFALNKNLIIAPNQKLVSHALLIAILLSFISMLVKENVLFAHLLKFMIQPKINAHSVKMEINTILF